MSKVLIDNNIWVAHEKMYPDAVSYINQTIENEYEICMTRIIEMELLSFSEIETNPLVKDNREKYFLLIDEMFEIDGQTTKLAAEIRRKAKLAGRTAPKGPDALIAATASIHKLILVSNNDKDFQWASKNYGFTYINPILNKAHYKAFCNQFEVEKQNGLK
ncbi:PIN domain-containing protein [Sutcliffiella horikoshii]|uniref:PIN domain-containing protein n=1 Tax=Sutcliffiella horikoshii TaxID=79883 RepID=UPI00384C3911